MNDPKPQLLAPAGQVESFFAALENGADGIYLGLKEFSARVSAANFRLEELSSLVPYAHKRKVAVYIALNSLIPSPELPRIPDLLQSLSDIGVDALIVQDPGVFFLARRLFPDLRLHASTLMAIHNTAGVEQLERLGARRVVLARELTLEEVDLIARNTSIELEIFVHGALCYSYSGLCLTSSFRGGHGSLQGRCVQPCRLRFRQGRKEGFFLSCSDLCALPLLPRLKRFRIASFKIEGRMKGADYIANVVRAYRMVLDAPAGEEMNVVGQAQELLAQSPSRRFTRGYLSGDFQREILAPHRSGSSGLWVGNVKSLREGKALIVLRRDLQPGDRLRPESGENREKAAFTVAELLSADGSRVSSGKPGERVMLAAPAGLASGDRLFRIGKKSKPASELWTQLKRETHLAKPFRKSYQGKQVQEFFDSSVDPRGEEDVLVIKVGEIRDVTHALGTGAKKVILTATRHNLERMATRRFTSAQKDRIAWSLPVLLSDRDTEYYRPAVKWFLEKGYRTWELNNWGHFDFFRLDPGANLIAGARFNIRNQAASAAVAREGCRWSVLSWEITNQELLDFGRGPFSNVPLVTVFCWPSLFTSRLYPALQEDKPFTTPRNETYLMRKKGAFTFIYADRPVNWTGKLDILRGYGYRHFLIDLSEGPHQLGSNLERVLDQFKRSRPEGPHDLFNFDRRP